MRSKQELVSLGPSMCKGLPKLTCVYAVQGGIGGGVAKAYATVSSTPSAGQQAMLMGRPGYRLHSSRMVAKAQDGRIRVLGPDEELIVVPAACNLSVIRRPLQPADLYQAAT